MPDLDLTEVSAEDAHGRVLSGVGTTVEALEATMERHAPDLSSADPAPTTEPEAVQPPVSELGLKEPRGKKRIDALTGEREAETRRANALEKELADLKARFSTTPVQTPAAEPAKPAPATATRTKPTEDQVGTTYQTYGDYVEDLADWKAGQRLAAMDVDARIRSSIEADRASRSQQERFAQSRARGPQVYPDFDAVIQGASHLQVDNWPMEKLQAIGQLEAPEHVLYALAKDPVLSERLRVADPVRFGMDLVRLIPLPAVARPASTAGTGSEVVPPPMQPVGSGSKTTGIPSADLVKRGSDFDASGYREKRAAERGVRRR